VDPNDSLRDAGARGATNAAGKGASRLLVIVEIGLAMVLVIGAGLMVKSLTKLQAEATGFNPDGLLTFQLSLPRSAYPKGDDTLRAYQRIIEEVSAVPGVRAAGAVNMLPLVNYGFNTNFNIVGRPAFATGDRASVVELRSATPGYFAAMGMTVRRGRDIQATDIATSKQIVVINATMANQFWPSGDPIGQRLSFGPGAANEVEIVGVVSDIRDFTLSTKPVIELYYPLAQGPSNGMGIVVRTELREPGALLPDIRRRIAAIDPNLPIVKPQTMTAVVDAAAGGTRLSSTLTAVFALLAGVLASVGIYSLIAYSVAERTRELGIRIALGADRRAIVKLIVGEGLVMAAAGLATGAVGAWLLTGTLRTMLYEVSPLDPGVFAMTAIAVLAVTILASYVPARRALRVDPMVALRAD
jgi:predicted permease